jgi:uncharacterized membrane protein YfhO
VSYDLDKKLLGKFVGLADSVIQKSKAENVRQSGFMAQEVEELVNKNAFAFYGVDKSRGPNDPYGIRYAEFVVPLVKAVQELAAKVEAQQSTLEEQRKTIDSLVTASSNSVSDVKAETANARTSLFQNNPNPFSVDTEIKMKVSQDAMKADLIIYNLNGNKLKSLPVADRGDVSVKVQAGELKPGIYLYSLIVDGSVIAIKRMIVTD